MNRLDRRNYRLSRRQRIKLLIKRREWLWDEIVKPRESTYEGRKLLIAEYEAVDWAIDLVTSLVELRRNMPLGVTAVHERPRIRG